MCLLYIYICAYPTSALAFLFVAWPSLPACLPACSGKAYQVVPYVMFNCLHAGSLYEGIPHEDSHDVPVA